MTTIKELADQLGMPKQRVYRYVKNHIVMCIVKRG